ncbi:MAG: hypothetical protein ACLGH3_03835 [Actinomycetota bacterium]
MRTTIRGRSRYRPIAVLVAGGLFVSLIGTIPAQAAAPMVFCAQAFGHEIPAQPCDPNPNQFAPPLRVGKSYPSSSLYVTSGGTGGFAQPPKGTIWVEGNATPGATVAVRVTDGTRTLGPFFVDASLQQSPGGHRRGDFRAEIQVAELGGHVATPGADADSIGDDELGPTLLTIDLTPSLSGATGAVKSVQLVKHAASEGDVFKPVIQNQKWPPRAWDRNCFANIPFYVVEIIFFQLFVNQPTPAHECAVWAVSGTILEETTGSANRFSEISDVRIEVIKGNKKYLDVRDSVDGEKMRARGEGGILTRYSTNANSYRLLLSSYDFPANNGYDLGMDDPYNIRVTICDAWGSVDAPNATPNNCVVSTSYDIVISPL